MTLVDSLWVSLLGLAVVFAVLILLSFFIKSLSAVLEFFTNNNKRETDGVDKQDAGDIAVPYALGEPDGEWSGGELKLIGVDEPTAAIIMAIISDESQIPLSQLRFKMIRAID
jgi:Na+-transporting methylmalonyl-CoA/oxaloacetate decarboxylase gamma subunit